MSRSERRSSRRLNVAVVVLGIDQTGGMELQARTLARALARRGSRVSILSTAPAPGVAGWLRGGRPLLAREAGVAVLRAPAFTPWNTATQEALFDGLALLYLLARSPRPDVLYAVQWRGAVRAAPFARILGAPLVVKLAGGGLHGDMAALARLEEGPLGLEALRAADAIACISPQIEAEVRGAGLTRVVRIPNGIDLERFREPNATEPGTERIVFVGAFRREKQLGVLVRAFARAAAERPLAELVLVGDGPEGPPTRALVSSLGLEARVRFLGARRDVPSILARASAFVLPSESEGLSNALLEALAARVPVIATDIEGNRAVVRDGIEGLLVPPGDEPALARALVRVLAEPELAAAFRVAGRAVAERHSLPVVAGAYEKAFRGLLRPEVDTCALLLRYVLSGPPGLLAVLRRGLSHATRHGVTTAVVTAKRVLGIKGDLLRRSS